VPIVEKNALVVHKEVEIAAQQAIIDDFKKFIKEQEDKRVEELKISEIKKHNDYPVRNSFVIFEGR